MNDDKLKKGESTMAKQNNVKPKFYFYAVFTVLMMLILASTTMLAAQQQPKLKPLSISYTPCQKSGGDVIITFSLPMVEEDQLGTAKHPEVIFEPQQKGTFKWQSPTELVFTPTPGCMCGGNDISMSINEAVPLAGEKYALQNPWHTNFWVPYLQIAGKVASWPIVIGQPRLIGLLNWYSGKVGRGPLFLLYDQPVALDLIKKHLEVKDETDQSLERLVYRPQDAKQVTESKIDPGWLVAVKINELPEEGKTIRMSIPDWKSGKLDFMDSTLPVNTQFGLMDKYQDNPRQDNVVRLKSGWNFRFNNPFELTILKEALQIVPQPKSVDVSGSWYNQARVQLELDPGTDYRMTLDKTFIDVLGNPLEPGMEIKFRSEDLPPILLVPAAPVLLERSGRRLPIKIRNVELIEAVIYRFHSPVEFARALSVGRKKSSKEYGLDQYGTKIQVPVKKLPANITKTIDLQLDVEPGLLCIEVTAVGSGSEGGEKIKDAVLVQMTDLGITAKVFEKKVFAWITNLHDPSPAAGAEVSLVANGSSLVSRGTADKFGIVNLDANTLASGSGLNGPIALIVQKNDDAAVCHLVNNELAQPWQFGLEGKVQGTGKLHAAVFTEWGVYRPSETVHLKVIVGNESNPNHQNRNVEIHIRDPRGQQVMKENISLDRFGSADLDVKLKEHAPVGAYMVQVTQITQGRGRPLPESKYIAVHKFRVEEYRVPTFQVSVKSEQEKWKRGADISSVIQARYLHGGSLAGRKVRWEVLRHPQPFAPSAFPKYMFSLGDAKNLIGSIAYGDKQLDGQGELVVNFKADHPSSVGPMLYVVEAAVTDVDRQTYAGRLSKIVHTADFYIGVLPPSRAVLGAGEALQVPIIAVTPEGKAVEGVRVTVQLDRIDHHTTARMSGDANVQLLNRPVPVKLTKCTIITKKTAVNCMFKLPGAGFYQVCATAEDRQHQQVQSGFKLAVSGDNPTAWPRFDQDRIEVIADKPLYKPGDTARLVVQTPYRKVRGLLTVERDEILDYRVFEIKKNTPTLLVPITDAYAPNIYVSVILLRGREHYKKDASGFETGAPGFKIGCAKLKVEPVHQRLSVRVNPAHKKVNPGQKMKVNLTVLDHKGAPAPGQATVMVVDEAVLGLTGYKTPDPVSQIYVERPLGVLTGSSRLDLPHARRARFEKIFPGGDGIKDILFSDFPMQLRKLFMSTAYWNPKVMVGGDGKAAVEFQLPDNLTTYRIMAVVTDENSRVGSADQQVLVRKPLMIQPVLPRFLYPNDQLRVETLVFNGTDTSGEIRVNGQFSGLDLINGSLSQRAVVKPGESQSFKFVVKVTGKKEAGIRFAAVLAGHTTDAVEVKLPVLSPGNQRTIVAGKSITGKDTVPVTLPADRIPGSVKMEVVTSTTVLSELKDSVQYLMRYPNGCIEQTTSTAYPLVVLKDLLPEIGIEVNQADLKKFSEAGIRRILSFQTPSGGLSYWPGDSQPHAFATAFGLTALIEAKKKGYDVPDQALAGMADYLEESLRKGKITESIPHGSIADADTRALFVMTLGRLGRPQPGYISVLWRSREKLSPFGLAFLAIAVREMPGDQSLLQPILEEIRQAANEEETEAYFSGGRKGGWSFDSPLRTHGSALIAYGLSGGSAEMSGKLLTGLLKRRQYGLWGNTQENVFGIMGVHTIAARKQGGDAPKIELDIHGREVSESEMEALSKRVRRITLPESELRLRVGKEEIRRVTLKNNGKVPIHLTVRAQYDVPLDEKYRKSQSNGFTITRCYETMAGESLEGKVIPLGSLVRVRVGVKTNNEHHYAAIDDKLPAGLEPLNASLATTERVSQGQLTMIAQRSLAVLSYHEIRDHRVAFYVDEMLPAEYEYTYVVRATTPGTFLRPAGRVEAMYQPEICATTKIDEVTVK
jgi:uncharacterized protein YfaS (alpha-2-macroglobulin family)